MPRGKYFFLQTYVVTESIHVLLTFAIIQSSLSSSSVQITFLSELTKLVIALIFLANGVQFNLSTIKEKLPFSFDRREYMKIFISTIMYLINTLLCMIKLKYTMPSTLHIAMLAKLPCIAILHHSIISPQRSFRAWVSLIFIMSGIFLVDLPSNLVAIIVGAQPSGSENDKYSPQLGLFIGLLIAIITAFTSISTEIILKSYHFWATQTWLYAFGSLAGAITLTIENCHSVEKASTASSPSRITLLMSVIAAAASGLVVANILRREGNLVKIVGSSASLVVVTIAQSLLFPHLLSKAVTLQMTAGVAITSIGTWTYNYYKESAESIPLHGRKEEEGSQEMQRKRDKLQKKLFWACAAIVQVILFTRLIFRTQQLKFHSFNEHFVLQPPADDISRFFLPHNATPTEWTMTANPSPRCGWDYILKHDITTTSSEIIDWEEAYLDSGCPVYPVPTNGLIFHYYWRGTWRSVNDFAIEAFLATQRLEDGHRLIYWYDTGGPPESTLKRFQPYSDFVEFREVDMLAESKGYCLEYMREWTDSTYREKLDMGIETLSDMLRTLLLAKYGGIWIDADAILLRDLTSLIRMGPWCVGLMFSSNPNMGFGTWTNALLNYGPVELGLGEKVLEVVCKMPFDSVEFSNVWPGFEPPEWWFLYNWSLMKIFEEKEGHRIGAIPQTWLDVFVDDPCTVVPDDTLPQKFRGLFVWHSKLDNESDDCLMVKSSTMAAKLRRSILRMLDDGLYMKGRDVIPQSLYIGLLDSSENQA